MHSSELSVIKQALWKDYNSELAHRSAIALKSGSAVYCTDVFEMMVEETISRGHFLFFFTKFNWKQTGRCWRIFFPSRGTLCDKTDNQWGEVFHFQFFSQSIIHLFMFYTCLIPCISPAVGLSQS